MLKLHHSCLAPRLHVFAVIRMSHRTLSASFRNVPRSWLAALAIIDKLTLDVVRRYCYLPRSLIALFADDELAPDVCVLDIECDRSALHVRCEKV